MMLYVFTMFWSFAAQIYLRFVLFFEEWPWRLARLVAPEESRARKMQVAVDLKRCKRECCLEVGLAIHIYRRSGAAEALVDDERIKGIIEHALESAPAENIASEDRFARMRNHMQA